MSLRTQALKGGAYLSLREGLGIGIRLAGTLAVTRIIGPTDYGLYAGALAAVAFLGIVAQMGLGVYVIRLEEKPTPHVYNVVFTVVAITGLATMLIALAGSFAVSGWLISPAHVAPFQVLLLALPLNVFWTPAQAKLERNLQYRRMAWIELVGDVFLCVVPIALALMGAGVWAPVAGYGAWQAWLLVGSCVAARYRPRIEWDPEAARAMVRYGLGYSSATWIYQTRELSAPLVVGTLLGPTQLGYAALATRIVETLCFSARATWRLSIAVFGRMQSDLTRLAAALSEGMALQVVVLAPLLGGFALVATAVVPAVFGDEWSPTVDVLPPLMLGYLLTSALNLEATALYARHESRVMVIANVMRIGLLFGLGFLLVPQVGLVGWGIAMAVHPLGFVWAMVRLKRIMPVRHLPMACWLLAGVPPLFAPYMSFPFSLVLLAPALAICSTPWARRELREYVRYVRSAMARRRTPAPGPA